MLLFCSITGLWGCGLLLAVCFARIWLWLLSLDVVCVVLPSWVCVWLSFGWVCLLVAVFSFGCGLRALSTNRVLLLFDFQVKFCHDLTRP